MAINLIKPTLTLIVEYTSGSEYVKFFEGGVVRTFLSDEFEELQQSQDFFDFVASVIKNYSSVTRNISYNVVDNWQELNECFDLFEDMTDNQKVLLDHVLCDYSYSYDLTTLTNYCLENACLFEGKASDYAYELIADCYDTKRMGNLVHYIDYDSFAGDMLLNSEIIELEYNLYWTNPHDIY